PLVAGEEPSLRRRQRPRRLDLAAHQMIVEADRATDGLACVVQDDVEAVVVREELPTERLDARRVTEVDAVDREAIAPLREVGLARVAIGGVPREARRHDYACAGAEEHDRRLIPDLDARAGDQRHASAEVRRLVTLRPVELRARRAHRVVEEVDASKLRLADVALPGGVEL